MESLVGKTELLRTRTAKFAEKVVETLPAKSSVRSTRVRTSQKLLVVVPTYNEVKNINSLIARILSLEPLFDILVVDGASTDGTAEALARAKRVHGKRVDYILQKSKSGLASAYIEGFRRALASGYEYIFEMDADHSHAPEDLPRLLAACDDKAVDFAIGSRYVSGMNVVNWSIWRLLLSYSANVYARLVTRLPIKDTTAGFVCWSSRALASVEVDKLKFSGYGFQIEMKFKAFSRGMRFREVPIIFIDRSHGKSKMSWHIALEAFFGAWRLRLRRL